MRRPVEAGADWAPLFLAALEQCGSIAPSARAAGVARRTVYDRRAHDAAFAALWAEALDVARSAEIVKRTARTDGTPDQLAARVRSVQYALRHRHRLTALADELGSVSRHLERQARELRQAWQRELPGPE
jgi:hypothetical protein